MIIDSRLFDVVIAAAVDDFISSAGNDLDRAHRRVWYRDPGARRQVQALCARILFEYGYLERCDPTDVCWMALAARFVDMWSRAA